MYLNQFSGLNLPVACTINADTLTMDENHILKMKAN